MLVQWKSWYTVISEVLVSVAHCTLRALITVLEGWRLAWILMALSYMRLYRSNAKIAWVIAVCNVQSGLKKLKRLYAVSWYMSIALVDGQAVQYINYIGSGLLNMKLMAERSSSTWTTQLDIVGVLDTACQLKCNLQRAADIKLCALITTSYTCSLATTNCERLDDGYEVYSSFTLTATPSVCVTVALSTNAFIIL